MNAVAVRTSAGDTLRTAEGAIRMVSPDEEISSAIRTRCPRAETGYEDVMAGRSRTCSPPSRSGIIIGWKSTLRI